MCGRYANSRGDAHLRAQFQITEVHGEQLSPSWNVAPTQRVRVILEHRAADLPVPAESADDRPASDDGLGFGSRPGAPVSRQLRTVRWGLIPSWAKDPKIASRLINARSETVTTKPAFKAAASRRRCLVPADGYFEWERRAGERLKVPHYLSDPDAGGESLAFAGLYELWPDPALDRGDPDRWRWTCVVLTTEAADSLGHIHDRSPVVLPPTMWQDWLTTDRTDLGDVRELLSAVPTPELRPVEVGRGVSDPHRNGPELVAQVPAAV
jgi:putative SOS response-associated peptidase YedK